VAIPLRLRSLLRKPRGRHRPVAVAITGGIGAGKSEALRAFARHGAAVISSDEIVHDLLRTDAGVKRAIASRWPQVVGPDGEIVRDRVAQVVFADAGELAWLERLLHPRVVSTYLSWRRDLGDLPEPPAVCVTEVPLLYEVGGETRFDAVVVITASPEVRIARHLRPLQDRERRLIPDEEKARRADFAYVNDGTVEELDAFVSGVMEKLGQ
jgi:dephospho-CoA kinase